MICLGSYNLTIDGGEVRDRDGAAIVEIGPPREVTTAIIWCQGLQMQQRQPTKSHSFAVRHI